MMALPAILLFVICFVCCCRGQSQFVLGSGGATPLWTSPDGVAFSPVPSSATLMTQVLGVQYSALQQRFCAVGSGTNTIAYSDDRGASWIGLGTTVFDTQGVELAYNPYMNRYVVVGTGTQNTLAYSSDCKSFVGLGKSVFDSEGQAVAFSGTQIRFVAVGGASNTIAWSTDGLTWIGLGPLLFQSASGVAFAQGLGWVVVGTPIASTTNVIAFSLNGTTWSKQAQNAFTGIGAAGRAVTYANGKFLASGSGNGGTMAFSMDGLSWTTVNPAVAAVGENGHGSAYSSLLKIWVSTCSDSTAANTVGYSKDNALTWTGLGNIGGGCYCVAAFDTPPLYLQNNLTTVVLSQPSVILPNVSVAILGTVTLQSDLLVHGNWSLGGSSFVNASGTLTINAKSTQVIAGGTLKSKILIVNPSTGLFLDVPQSMVPAGANQITIPVAYYSELYGAFASVSVSFSGVPVSSFRLDYGASVATLSVLLQTAPQQGGSSTGVIGAPTNSSSVLSSGAIVGIVIGTVIASTLVIIGAVLLTRYFVKTRDAQVNSALRLEVSKTM